MISIRISPSATLCAVLSAAVLATPARGAGVEDFYRGKTVNIIIGYSVGGGYDIYARLLGRHIGKYIPGRPTIVPQNLPGTGSIKALEYLATVAPKDGLTFGTFGRSLPLSPLLEDAKYDIGKLEWVGSITSDTSTCIAWHATGIRNLNDAKTKQFTVGGLGKGSDPDIFASVMKNSFGLNIKLVTGYPGTRDLTIALERGEIDGICGYTYSTIRTSHKAWLEGKRLMFLAQIGLARDRELPDVPLMLELGANPQQREALRLISLSQSIARPFALPMGTDGARVEALRAAFMATMKDKEFLAEANSAGLEVNPYTGQQVADLFAKPIRRRPTSGKKAGRRSAN